MPRRNPTPVNQTDIGQPQTIFIQEDDILPSVNVPSIIVGAYLKKNYWDMAKNLEKKYECSICLEEIDCRTGCERCFTILTCGHIFHLPCIIRCPNYCCPLCRSSPQ